MSAADEWRVEEEVGKHQLMRRTGLPARDLRALGPPLSHPSASILGRDRAVVVCLDRVRAVVTTSEVLVPGPRDPAVAQLVRDLLARLGGGSAHTPTASPAPPQVTVRLLRPCSPLISDDGCFLEPFAYASKKCSRRYS